MPTTNGTSSRAVRSRTNVSQDRRRSAYARSFGAAFVVVVAALLFGMAWHAFAGGVVLIAGAVAIP